MWTLNEVSRARWTKYLAASFCLYLLSESHRFCNRVQDSYTLRCCPQVRDFANNCTGKATIKKLCENTLIKQTGHSLFARSLDKQLKIDPKNSILLCELTILVKPWISSRNYRPIRETLQISAFAAYGISMECFRSNLVSLLQQNKNWACEDKNSSPS